MIIVPFQELRHYPLMLVWWLERSFQSTALHLLPPVGLAVELADSTPIAAGFLYGSDGGCAQISHLVADPALGVDVRSPAVDMLIVALEREARQRGYRMLSGATNLPGLQKRYERLGFQVYDRNVTIVGKEF